MGGDTTAAAPAGAGAAVDDGNDHKLVVVIEHCVDCKLHCHTTQHKEEKYLGTAAAVTDAIKATFPHANVLCNLPPSGWSRKRAKPGHKRAEYTRGKGEVMTYPRLGAFEVYVRGAVVRKAAPPLLLL